MSCLSALPSQLLTIFLVPHKILFLQHDVYGKYAKIAISQDFIHTLPTIIIFAALVIMYWKNPPGIKINGSTFALYNKILQASTSWLFISALMWLWLVSQQIIYCTMWIYWSQESEYREIALPWWQRVWFSYFPSPLNPPVLSSSFLSWIMCMFFASMSLACAFFTDHVKPSNIGLILCQSFENVYNAPYLQWITTFFAKIMINESEEPLEQGDKSECSSISDFPSEVGNGDVPNGHKIMYTLPTIVNKRRKSSKSPEFVKAYETFSTNSSTRTTATNNDTAKYGRGDNQNNLTAMHLRQPRSA